MGFLDSIGSVISGAINTVEDVGKTVADAATGNFSGAVNDLGKGAKDLVGTAVNGFMAMNPELGAVKDVLGLIGGMAGQGGFFNPGQACGTAPPFGLGGMLPGILQDPLAALFGGLQGLGGGGSPGLGVGFPGLGGGGFPFPGTGGGLPGIGGFPGGFPGGAGPGGSVGGSIGLMQQMQQYEEAQSLAIAEAQLMHKLRQKAIDAIAQA
jgi:hypothetical protein